MNFTVTKLAKINGVVTVFHRGAHRVCAQSEGCHRDEASLEGDLRVRGVETATLSTVVQGRTADTTEQEV